MDQVEKVDAAAKNCSEPQQLIYGDVAEDSALDELLESLHDVSPEGWALFIKAVHEDPWSILEYYKSHATRSLLTKYSKEELISLASKSEIPSELNLFKTFAFQTLRLLLVLEKREDLAILLMAAELDSSHTKLNDLYAVQYLLWMLEHNILGYDNPWPDDDFSAEETYKSLSQSNQDNALYDSIRDELRLWVMTPYPRVSAV